MECRKAIDYLYDGWLLVIICTTAASIVTSVYSLSFGWFVVFQNIFYFPIVVACFRYGKKGFGYSVGLSICYFCLIISFSHDRRLLLLALIRVVNFVGVAFVISYLSSRTKTKTDSERDYLGQQIQLILDCSNEGIFGLDLEGRHTFVSQAAAKMLGYEVSELIGRCSHTTWHYKHADGTPYAEEDCPIIKTLKKGEMYRDEECFVRKDGTTLPVGLISTPIFKDGVLVGAGVIFRDITKSKRIEAKLRQSEISLSRQNSILAALLNNLPLGVFMVEVPTGAPLVVNDAALDLLGRGILPEATISNLSHAYKAYRVGSNEPYPPKEMPIFMGMNGQSSRIDDMQVERPDGTTVNLEIFGSPVLDDQGRVWASLATFHDITDRRKSERALIQAERLGAVGEMTSGVAHDFNNALGVMMGNVELALSVKNFPSDAAEYLYAAIKSGGGIASRIRQLQRFSRKVELNEHCSLNLNSLVQDVISQTRPLWKDEAEKNGLSILVKTSLGVIETIDGDPGELGSVLHNLLKNSVEAMPRGGTILVETGIEEENVFVRVVDSGMGMEDETRKKLFEPFFTTKGNEPGRGLGMNAVYSIIRDHHGSISVKETGPGKGTTIEMLFPFGTKQQKPFQRESLGINNVPAKVLWADDDEGIRTMAEGMLGVLGHQFDIVTCGAEALELLSRQTYDLVITDMAMQGMSGCQLAAAVHGKYPEMKVVIISGYGSEISSQEVLQNGVERVLSKPFSMEQLRKIIEEVVQAKN